MTSNKLGLTGLFIAFTVALPLFVWTAINVNFNLNKRAQGEPNFCGGTCGSNYNCQANFYCYAKGGETQGFCRNPICSDDTDCVCDPVTPSPTPKSIASVKPTATSTIIPKGGNDDYSELINKTPKPLTNIKETMMPEIQINEEPENMFFAKYALWIFGIFALIVIVTLYFVFRNIRKPKNIPQILPPTNI